MAETSAPRMCLRDVSAAYGPFRALFGVSLSVDPAQVTALVGPNGAGKTTVARVCTGLVTPTSGRVLLDGEDVTGAAPHTLSRRGVAHVVEGRSVFATLTVEENLGLFLRGRIGPSGVSTALARCYARFPQLARRRGQVAGTLSGGEQRMLSLAWALAVPPALLVCDEPSLGLTPGVIAEVYDALRAVREQGSSLLIIEQHLPNVLDLADTVVVLGQGEVVAAATPDDVRSGRVPSIASLA